MTSIVNKNAQSANSVKAKSMIECHLQKNNSESLQAEIIEVVPELLFDNESDDGYSEFSDEDDQLQNPFTSMHNEDEPFDEYAYQVNSNNSESNWLDNSQSMPMTESDSDVILIDDDDDRQFDENITGFYNGGLKSNRFLNGTNEHKTHTCDICHSKLSSSYNLKRHMMIHTGEKPFECSICNRRFREQSDLRKHKRIHIQADLTSKCSLCHRNYISNSNSKKCMACEKLENIQKTNSNACLMQVDGNSKKSFVCKFCDRAFGSSSNLKRHVMIHTGEKPFTCPECKRPFREMSTLKKHLVTHRRQIAAPMQKTQNADELKSNPPQSLNKCPFCRTICKGTDGLMNHIKADHQPNKNNISSIVFNYLNVKTESSQ